MSACLCVYIWSVNRWGFLSTANVGPVHSSRIPTTFRWMQMMPVGCWLVGKWAGKGKWTTAEFTRNGRSMKKSINVQYENYRLWLQWTLHCLTLSFTSALWMLEVRSPVPLADGPAEVQARVTHRPIEPHILCTGSINNKHSVGWLTFVNDSNTIKTLFNACSCHISLVYTSFWCFRAVHSNMWPQYITCLMVS